MVNLTPLERFARERTPISNEITEGISVSRFAQPHLSTGDDGSPVLSIRVWDLDEFNPVQRDQVYLVTHEVESVEITEQMEYVLPDTGFNPYISLTYKLTLTEEAGYAVLRGAGDETVFVSWSAQGEEGRVFSDRRDNKVRWSDGWVEG